MTTVAVIAHAKKMLGDGLPQLRAELERRGIVDPIWHEIPKSKHAPARVEKALAEGADLIFAWGGDGTVQRCIDAMVGGPEATLAILPAGTANLLATNLGVPIDLQGAVEIGLHGPRRTLDVAKINGEHFAVMAGCGFDALMIRDADGGLKHHLGRAAYVWTGAKNLRASVVRGRVRVDGEDWFDGKLSCVLVANVGSVFGNVDVFDNAQPDDGRLDVGVVTAKSLTQWVRLLTRAAVGTTERSPFVHTTTAHTISIRLRDKTPFELDGGDRPATKKIKIKIRPHAIRIAVPEPGR